MRQKHISSYILKVTIVLSLLMVNNIQASAQQKNKQAAEAPADTIPLFRGVAVSADLAGIAQIAFSDYGQYEAALRINLKDKYFPIIELGYGQANSENIISKLSYKTKAPYGRIGMDFNLMKNKHDIYRIYGGFRYAYTSFKFDVEGNGITDPVWGDQVEYSAKGIKASYHWLEAVFGLDAKIWGPIRLGWSFRYKRRLIHNDGSIGSTWYVPGYGKQGGTRLGGTFNISIEL